MSLRQHCCSEVSAGGGFCILLAGKTRFVDSGNWSGELFCCDGWERGKRWDVDFVFAGFRFGLDVRIPDV